MIRDALTALLGLAGFGMLGCVSPTFAGQALAALIGLGLIGAAYIVWVAWGWIANLVDIDQVKQEGDENHE